MLNKHIGMICILLLCAVVIALGITVHMQSMQIDSLTPRTAGDLGIDCIMEATVVSACFDSQNPNLTYDIQDISQVTELLDTLDDAVFYKIHASTPFPYYTLVRIQTTESTYGIGIGNGMFWISVNGEAAYYSSSAATAFQEKLDEIHARNLNDTKESE